MKNLLKVFLVSIAFTLSARAQEQVPPDWIRQHEGIPIIGSMHWHWLRDNPDAVKDMKKAGVDVLRFHIENENHIATLKDTSQGYGFQFIPGNTLGYNYIHYYTDAKYSVWEAEGNPDYDANLIFFDDTKMNDSVMVVRGSGNNKYLKLLPNAASLQDTTLIWGPYYRQDVNYFTTLDGIYRKVDYRADYRMKLEWEPTADTTQYYNPSTEICRVQITYSYAIYPDSLSCTYAIVDSILTLEKFLPLDNWTDFIFEYDLVDDPCADSPEQISPQSYTDYMSDFRSSSEQIPRREDRKYIQFKVIWFGNPDFLLSIDKVTISDDRGRDLVFQTFPTDQIQSQDDLIENYYDFITGYIGFDEPTSLDIAEPIRIVKELLDTKSDMKRPLWLPWMQFWDASFESRNNTFGAMSLNPWLEFKKRVGQASIIQNTYLFDLPCNDSVANVYTTLCAGDWRATNIERMVKYQYKQAAKIDPYWGASIQCGEDTPPYGNSYQRNIARHEFLYTANLALMSGAKFLDLYTYFARSEPTADPCILCNAIVNWTDSIANDTTTDKYDALKDTLNPRLEGLFGKTLKKLVPKADTLGIDAQSDPYLEGTPPFSFIDYIEAIGGMNETCLMELGEFTDPSDPELKYFMPINRYYSTLSSIDFGLKNLTQFRNWKLTDYVDTTVTTLTAVNQKADYSATILPGDAKLYSLGPVVKYGGTLAVNDTISSGTLELVDNMTIDNGVNLVVDAEYIASDTITLSGTGFITGSGFFSLSGNGEVITNSWNRSLFRSKNGNHPKILWGEYPESGRVTGYEVQRNLEGFGWSTLATLGSSVREYTDSTQTLPSGTNLWEADYRVNALLEGSETPHYSNEIYYKINNPLLGKDGKNSGIVYTYNLFDNYPNPFNPSTTIKYSIKEAGLVELDVLNILGEKVSELVREVKSEGEYEYAFNASALASGVDLYRIKVNDFLAVKKMILVK